MTNTSTPNPIEALAAEISSLQGRLNSVQNGIRLASIRDEVEDLDSQTRGLDQRLRDLRGRGYCFEKNLEPGCAGLGKRWLALKPQIVQQVNIQSAAMTAAVGQAEHLMVQLSSRSHSPAVAKPFVAQVNAALSTLEGKVSAAESTIRGMYDTYQEELKKLVRHLDQVDWMLTQLAEASFQLLPTEAGIMAVEAVWVKDGKEDGSDPKGVLYLTDQRLIFEQKQEVATKKILFITTEKQKVQQMAFEAPVALIQSVEGSKQGFFKNEDHLDLKFASGAPFYDAHFHIDGQEAAYWQGLVGQARSKAFDQDRAVAIDTEAVEKVKAAPTQCPACGGAITQTILRGMDSISCAYCGHVIRL